MKKQNGQVLVEFAILLPVLFIFVFGAIEVSWFLLCRMMISNSAITAVEYATGENIIDPDEIEEKVREAAGNIGLAPGEIEVFVVSRDDTVGFAPKYALVNIEHRYKPLIGNLIFKRGITIRVEGLRYYEPPPEPEGSNSFSFLNEESPTQTEDFKDST